jgi:hypothetical protein
MDARELRSRLMPFGDEILQFAYRQLAEDARQSHVTPIWMYLTLPGEDKSTPEYRAALVQSARSNGFTIVDFSKIYDDYDVTTLQVAAWDHHPNVRGHQLVADRLLREWPKIEAAVTGSR